MVHLAVVFTGSCFLSSLHNGAMFAETRENVAALWKRWKPKSEKKRGEGSAVAEATGVAFLCSTLPGSISAGDYRAISGGRFRVGTVVADRRMPLSAPPVSVPFYWGFRLVTCNGYMSSLMLLSHCFDVADS